ncbi:CLUMA_CG015657, isoform A [Clunio marinus]|uniref:CLUMA_CG015657, isoform A n=1 Tax=Clunio marinus TaxID=568069 RepID=A0A1J1IPZ5_9DIPT|nr:CLUMA_CG015657, isoform A [Clunio marinus]
MKSVFMGTSLMFNSVRFTFANGYKYYVLTVLIPKSSQSGITFPLNLTQLSAQSWPSKNEPNIFLHCAQFLKHTPRMS